MRNQFLRRGRLFFALAVSLAFLASGCAATKTLIKKRKLNVETRMSETVFLEPVSPDKRVVYVDIKNTSDKEMSQIEYGIKGRIASSGYSITEDPARATYILQANIVRVGKTDLDEANSLLGEGYQGVVEGAVLGAAVGGAIGGEEGALIGGIATGVAGFLFDSLVSDVLYTMVTDIQIRERAGEGETVSQTQETDAAQGTATRTKQTSVAPNVQWKIYRTRIVSVANKSNLDFEKARPHLEDGLVRSIGGIF